MGWLCRVYFVPLHLAHSTHVKEEEWEEVVVVVAAAAAVVVVAAAVVVVRRGCRGFHKARLGVMLS